MVYPVQNVMYVPHEGQELRWSGEGMLSCQEYRIMIEKADGVVYLHKRGQSFKVVDVLMERNHAICNASDKIIGVYEGMDFHHNWIVRENHLLKYI